MTFDWRGWRTRCGAMTAPMTERGRAWVITALVLTVLTVAAAVLAPIPFVARSPGPLFDILGTVDDKPVLVIDGAESYPTTGVLDMTTVAESGGSAGPINVGTALVGLFSSDTSVLPDEDADEPDSRQAQEAVFDASQSQALGAAAGYLDRPVTSQVVVVQVLPDSAADGVLEAGDVIVAVDGDPIRGREELVTKVRASPPGTTIRFRIKRAGEVQTVSVTSRPDPDDPESALVGIVPENRYRSDFTATVNLDGIGGPSAGLMLAVGMVDKLTPGDLLLGRRVAGTGTVDGNGVVGAIGGIDKKMLAAQEAGAELFIAPRDNCTEVLASQPEGLEVAAVADLDQTMTVLQDWRDNKPVRGCPRTGDE